MRLILKEYLRSLRERDELDAMLPDLLAELGFTVFSRPAIGVPQHGVDVAAVGTDTDGLRKVFLFTIKAGDIRRGDWSGPPQSVRPSLEEILDVYIPTRLPSEYADLEVLICICFGGDLHQSVDTQLQGFESRNTTERVSFRRWNGDVLAEFLMSGVLGPELLPADQRSSFRKSIAMLDEPNTSYAHFCTLVERLVSESGDDTRDKIRVARQVTICLWVLFAWSREANNLEAPYRASEFAMLHLWHLGAKVFGTGGREAKDLEAVVVGAINLYGRIAQSYTFDRILPHVGVKFGISHAVASGSSLDVNLKLFDVLGRLALCGLWLSHAREMQSERGDNDGVERTTTLIDRLVDGTVQLVMNNPALMTPVKDDHAIDINLSCLFLTSQNHRQFVGEWVKSIASAACYSVRAHSKYPCVLTDYRKLLAHPPDHSPDYLKRATNGSILYPTLAFWAISLGDESTVDAISSLLSEELDHCTVQLWYPGADTEENLYTNTQAHGVALTGFAISGGGESLIEAVTSECERNPNFDSLSAIRLGQYPLVLMACRHYRLPIPPNFWRPFFPSQASAVEA